LMIHHVAISLCCCSIPRNFILVFRFCFVNFFVAVAFVVIGEISFNLCFLVVPPPSSSSSSSSSSLMFDGLTCQLSQKN
jgi:hypothetical protein